MEHSYGIIPLRERNQQWETLLVKHGKGHWAFPKGHPDQGESPQETASRELKEETALSVTQFLPFDSLEETYFYKKEGKLVEKKVTYFLAEVEGDVKIQLEEIEEARWLSFEKAIQLATFPETKHLARQVSTQLVT